MNIEPRRLLSIGFYVVAALLVLNVARMEWSETSAQASAAEAYTVGLIERAINANGIKRLGSIQTFAKRSDGATVFRLGREGRGSRRITYPDGIVVEVNDVKAAKTSIQVPVAVPVAADKRRDPAAGCRLPDERQTFEGEGQIQGLRVARFSASLADRKAATAYAIDADCVLVHQRLEFATGERSETELASFQAGPPSDSLFAVPAHYVEGPPSSLWTSAEIATCKAGCQAALKRQDDEYQRMRLK